MTTILMVLSSNSHTDGDKESGWFLPEAAHPWSKFVASGFKVVFASPLGGSSGYYGQDLDDPVQSRFLEEFGPSGPETVSLSQIGSGDFEAVFFVGGHGAMWDFPESSDLATVASGIYENGGVVSAVCHGPAALVNVKLSDGSFLVAGKRLAAFTNSEEEAIGLTEMVPFPLETKLGERGAEHQSAPDFEENAVADGRLVTGQNPASAVAVARLVIGKLS